MLTNGGESTVTGAEEEGEISRIREIRAAQCGIGIASGSGRFHGGLRRHFEARLGRLQWELRRRELASWTAVERRWGRRFRAPPLDGCQLGLRAGSGVALASWSGSAVSCERGKSVELRRG